MNGNKEILLRWGKWRIGYNLILLVEGLWVLREHLVTAFIWFWWFMALFAIVANVCFILGPWLEIGARCLLGSRADRLRGQTYLRIFCHLLFWLGLVFSMWLVWMCSLQGLGQLGGSIHYNYTTEFQDQTMAFIYFLVLAFPLYVVLLILFRFALKSKGKGSLVERQH